ncbi:MAG: PD40 domain-containing protein [Deltaproteobacteria bacterium]|nr:PD40 domain-containing protein [Deltaproteobacteria bacterium]
MARLVRFAILVSSLALASVLGCTRNPDPMGDNDAYVPPGVDAGIPTSGNLRIDPLDHVVMLAGGAGQVVEYRAYLRDGSGSETEVTSAVSWSTTAIDLGSFAGSTFTTASDRGGRTNIVATYMGMTTSTTLTVQFERIIIADGATAETPTRFDGTATAGAGPEVVYPDDGAMVPPNLGSLELHYMPNGGDAFELAVTTPDLDLRIYFGCPESVGGGCIYSPSRAVWQTIATAAAGRDPITYQLRSVSAAGEIREGEVRTLAVAQEPITGGLYYWNAGGGSIDRFEFGVPGARAERFIGTGQTGAGMCVGCHALSRDGTRISVGTDIPTTTFQVFDVATRTRIFSLGSGGGFGGFPSQPNFASWAPDSSELVTSFNTGLSIRNPTTGAIITDRLGGGPSSQPDWSPDGQHIVFVRHDAPSFAGLVDVGGVSGGRITILDRAGSEWGSPRTIVSIDGVNNYYPSYSPDGRFISFCRSPSNINSMGADPDSGTSAVPDAELWLIPSDRSGAARQLTTIAGLADSWPKWDPTEYENQGRPLYWMSWTSRRSYGLRLARDQRAQIWMAAFDPTVAATGEQGFRAAFWLPAQDIGTANHIPQWVTSVERQTCTDSADCGGEFCIDGRCFEEPPLL